MRFLPGLNPLAKLAAPIPAMVALVFVRDVSTPLVFLALAYLVLLVGAPFGRRLAVTLFVALPAVMILIAAGFALWADPAQVAGTPALARIGGWTLHTGAIGVGVATGLRLSAIFALALIAGAATTGADLARSLVQQLRVPYRIGYTALAALRFVPRLGTELELIRQAHRVRGAHAGAGPFAAIARGAGYVVPLMAGSIRHAERVAWAMDARAFGAYTTRTERHMVPWRTRDAVFIAVMWVATAAILLAGGLSLLG